MVDSALISAQNSARCLASRLILLTDTAIPNGLDVNNIVNQGTTLEESSLQQFSKTVDDLGGGGYALFYKVCIYIVVIMIMVGGAALIFSSSSTRSEAKSGIITKVAGAFLIFSAVPIAVLLQIVGTGLFGG